MKRYVMLIAFTLIAVLTSALSGEIWRNSYVSVSCVKLNNITAESSVSCSGKVERAELNSYFASNSSVVEEIYVKKGEMVSVGTPLFKTVTVIENGAPGEYQQAVEAYASLLGKTLPASNYPVTQSKITVASSEGEISSVASVGQTDSGTPVVTLSGNKSLQVRLQVNESQIADIAVGQPVQITGAGFKNSVYKGTVKSISAEARQSVSTGGQEAVVEVVVAVNNPGADIKPGFTAKVKIVTALREQVLIAPYEAVQADEDGTEYVYCVAGNRAVKTPIQTGAEYEAGFEIKSGVLKDTLVVKNPENLSDYARIVAEKGEPNA